MTDQKGSLSRLHLLMGAGGLTAGLAGITGIFVINRQTSNLLRPVYQPPRKQTFFHPEEFGLTKEEIQIYNPKHRLNLSGWLIPAISTSNQSQGRKKKPLVIYAHGYGENRASHQGILKIAKALADEGISTLVFDFQNHGLSDPGKSTLGIREKHDLHAAIAYAKEKGYTDIGLIGASMGASTALQVAAESSEVKAVIADTAYTDLRTFGIEMMQKRLHLSSQLSSSILSTLRFIQGMNTNAIRPIDAVKKLREAGVAVRFYHTKGDRTTDEHHGHDLAEAYGDPSALQMTPMYANDENEQNHCRSIDVLGDRFTAQVVDAFRGLEHMKRKSIQRTRLPESLRMISDFNPSSLFRQPKSVRQRA